MDSGDTIRLPDVSTADTASINRLIMTTLLEVNASLKKVGIAGTRIKMPRICVIGAQSAGKTSTLNALIGDEILPTDDGVCTRVPIQVNMINIGQDKEEYG